MGFGTGGNGSFSLSGGSDVALNNPINSNVLTYDGATQKWKNGAVASGSFRASVIVPEDYGVIANGTTDNTTAWDAVVAAANTQKKPIWVTGRYRGQIDASNKRLEIFGPGTLVQASGDGPVIKASHAPGAKIPVVSVDQDFIVGPSKASDPSTYSATAIKVATSSLNQFVADDVWGIACDDTYEWSAASSGGAPRKAGLISISGVVFQANFSDGDIKENDTIRGSSSTATALVGSVARVSSTVGQIIVKSIASGKTFTNNETLTVDGVAKGTINSAGSVLMHGELEDDYPTNPVLRKFRDDLPVVVDGLSFDVSGDPDGLVGTSNRNETILIKGAVKPILNDLKIYNSWTSGIKITSCYRPVVSNFWMGRGANNATTGSPASNQPSEQGYGYGIEITGSTYGGSFQINGSMMRHGFTTNPNAHSAAGANSSDEFWMNGGTCRHNIVHDSTITDSWSAGFDNHAGAYDTTYINCLNIRTAGAHRRFSGMNGFNNRALNTTYINCRDVGSAQSFNDSTRHFIISKVSTTRYINCISERYQYTGFSQSQPDLNVFHRAEFINCRATGDGRPYDSPYKQSGFDLTASNTIMRGCVSEGFNGDGILIASSSSGDIPTIVIDDLFLDFRDTAVDAAVCGIRVTASVKLNITSRIKIFQKTGEVDMPSASITVTGGSPTVRTAGATVNVAGTKVIPIITGASSTTVTGL